MIMLDVDPVFSEMRGMANLQMDRLLRNMEEADAEAGALTVKIRVERGKMMVPEGPGLDRVAVVPAFDWKVTSSIPVRHEVKGEIRMESMEMVVGPGGAVRFERIRSGQMSIGDFEGYEEGAE